MMMLGMGMLFLGLSDYNIGFELKQPLSKLSLADLKIPEHDGIANLS